jgi:hypothetical protein
MAFVISFLQAGPFRPHTVAEDPFDVLWRKSALDRLRNNLADPLRQELLARLPA